MCAIIIGMSSNSRSIWINLIQLIRPLFALAQIIHSVMSISDLIKVMRCTFFCIRLFCVFIWKKKCFRLFSTKIAQRAEAIVRKNSTQEKIAHKRETHVSVNLLCLSTHTKRAQWDRANWIHFMVRINQKVDSNRAIHFIFLFSLSLHLYLVACWKPIIHLRQRQFLLMKIKCSSLDFTQYWPHLSKGLCGPRTSREREKVFKLLSPRHS